MTKYREKKLAKENKSIKEHAEELCNQLAGLVECGYIKNKDLEELVKIACIYHDDGKANKEFQERINSNKKFDKNKEVPHNVLSAYFLSKKPKDLEDNEITDLKDDDYYRILFAILYHHNYDDPYEIIRTKPELISTLMEPYVNETEIKNIDRRMLNKVKEMARDDTAILIKGLLHKCDYSASGGYDAEYKFKKTKFIKNYLSDWKKTGIEWNLAQIRAYRNRNNNIILIAQTGMGKTEAGLRWMDNNKGFFVLPLQSAINSIYDRTYKLFKDGGMEETEIEKNIAMLHSNALDYYMLMHKKDYENNTDGYDAVDYYERGKHLSVPLTISTVDQLFDFVFKYPGYEFKLATLSYSKIVIDEIQMYDAKLLAYLIYGIKEIIRVGGKVAIITATLAPFIREYLKQDNFIDDKAKRFIDLKEFTNEEVPSRHYIECYNKGMTANEILNIYNNVKPIKYNEGSSKKILVICNSVEKAQNIYNELNSDEEIKNKLNIFHSRFIKKERDEKEKKIIEFGQTDKTGESGIWISTSIVEASLDLDFDYLITELQDLSSLFQRMGRCNRKGKKEYKSANCYIFMDDQAGYSDFYKISEDALNEFYKKKKGTDDKRPISEDEKFTLINDNFTKEKVENTEYYMIFREEMRWLEAIDVYEFEKHENELRDIQSVNIIPLCCYNDNIESEVKSLENEIKAIQDGSKTIDEKEKINRIKEKRNEIKRTYGKYTVNIPYKDWLAYQSDEKLNQKNEPKEISKYETIWVVNCMYDERGFVKKDNLDKKEKKKLKDATKK